MVNLRMLNRKCSIPESKPKVLKFVEHVSRSYSE